MNEAERLDARRAEYPHVPDWQADIAEDYADYFNNTGGNSPLDLLNDLNGAAGQHFAAVNVVRFTLAVAVHTQVVLINTLKEKGLLP